MNGAFEDPIGLAGVDCESSGSVGMLLLCNLLPFFEEKSEFFVWKSSESKPCRTVRA